MKKTKPRQAKKKTAAKKIPSRGIMARGMKARGTGRSKRMDDIMGGLAAGRGRKKKK